LHAEPPDIAAVKVELRLAEKEREEGLIEATVADTTQTIYLHKEPLLTNKDFAEARVVLDQLGRPAVNVIIAKAAQQKMGDAPDSHRGKPLAILLDGKVLMAPIILDRVSTSVRITGDFSQAEAERIARGLVGKE